MGEIQNKKILTTDRQMAIRKDIHYTVGSVSGYMGLERICFNG